jgi:hypothetical protein
MSIRSFEFLKSVQERCQDFAEFDQAIYIKEALHDGTKGRSIFNEGVCASLCVYTISDWITNGTQKRTIDQYVSDCNILNSSRPTLEPIVELAYAFDTHKDDARQMVMDKIKAMTKGKEPISTAFDFKPSEAIDATIKFGPCFMAWGGIVKTGHAIICDGLKHAFFDPNYGYYQTVDSDNDYFWIFKRLIAEYPNFATNAAITLYPYYKLL